MQSRSCVVIIITSYVNTRGKLKIVLPLHHLSPPSLKSRAEVDRSFGSSSRDPSPPPAAGAWSCRRRLFLSFFLDEVHSSDLYFPPLLCSKPDLAENARQGLNKLLANEVPIEIKPVNPPNFYRLTSAEPKKLFWVRARGYIGIMDYIVFILHCESTVF